MLSLLYVFINYFLISSKNRDNILRRWRVKYNTIKGYKFLKQMVIKNPLIWKSMY